MAAPRIGESESPVQTLLPSANAQLDRAEHWVRIVFVVDRLRDVHVDAAHRINHLDHAPEIGNEHGVNWSLCKFGDGGAHCGDPRDTPLARPELRVVEGGIGVHLIQELLEAATRARVPGGTRRERHVHHVARKAEHRDSSSGDINLNEQHHIHASTPSIWARIRSEQQQVELTVIAPRDLARSCPWRCNGEGGERVSAAAPRRDGSRAGGDRAARRW